MSKSKRVQKKLLTLSTVTTYFDEKPKSKEIDFTMENTIQDQTSETTKHAVELLPSFSSCDIGKVFR